MRELERLNVRGDLGASILRAARQRVAPESSRRRATAAIWAAAGVAGTVTFVAPAAAASMSAAAAATGAATAAAADAVQAGVIAGPAAVGASAVATASTVSLIVKGGVVLVMVAMAVSVALPHRVHKSPPGVSEPETRGLAAPAEQGPRVEVPHVVPAEVSLVGAESPRVPSQASPAHEGKSQPGLADEVAALEHAQLALEQGDSAEALRLVDAFAKDFPRPHMKPEADALRIEALHAHGDVTGARGRLKAFRAEYPESPLLEHLEAVAR